MKKLLFTILLTIITVAFASDSSVWKESWALDAETIEEGILPLGLPIVDANGNLYIMDRSLGSLHKFTPDGKHQMIGKKGQAPHELGFAASFTILKDDTVVISDAGGQSLKYFNQEGKFLKVESQLAGGFPQAIFACEK